MANQQAPLHSPKSNTHLTSSTATSGMQGQALHGLRQTKATEVVVSLGKEEFSLAAQSDVGTKHVPAHAQGAELPVVDGLRQAATQQGRRTVSTHHSHSHTVSRTAVHAVQPLPCGPPTRPSHAASLHHATTAAAALQPCVSACVGQRQQPTRT